MQSKNRSIENNKKTMVGKESTDDNIKKEERLVTDTSERGSVKERFDILFAEYTVGVEHTKRYSSYSNMILNYSFIGVSALLAWTVKEENILTYKIVCIYLTPIVVYITGLMYLYTMYMIGKVETFLVRLESSMNTLLVNHQFDPIHGWNHFMRKDGNTFNFLAYGPLFVIYSIYPLISCALGIWDFVYMGDPKLRQHRRTRVM